jgi:hypothetical protein
VSDLYWLGRALWLVGALAAIDGPRPPGCGRLPLGQCPERVLLQAAYQSVALLRAHGR